MRRPLGVVLEHGCRDFGTGRPLSAPRSGMGNIVLQVFGIGLNYLAVLEEYQPCFIGRHAGDKGVGFVETVPPPRHGRGGIRRLGCARALRGHCFMLVTKS